MLNTMFKASVAFKLKGNAPMVTDEELQVITYEGIQFLSSRTTPKSLITFDDVDEDEVNSFRAIEDGYYIRIADVPDFTGAEPTEVIDMDEELTVALIYYVCYIVVKPKGGVPDNIKAEYLSEAERLINLYDSNFTRSGDELYDVI